MSQKLPLLAVLASLAVPAAAFASAADQQYTDPYGGSPTVKHAAKKHAAKKHRSTKHRAAKHKSRKSKR